MNKLPIKYPPPPKKKKKKKKNFIKLKRSIWFLTDQSAYLPFPAGNLSPYVEFN